MASIICNPLPAWYFSACLHNQPQESALFSSILFNLQYPANSALAEAALDQLFLLDQWKVLYALPQVLRATVANQSPSFQLADLARKRYADFFDKIGLEKTSTLLSRVVRGRAIAEDFVRVLDIGNTVASLNSEPYFDLSEFADETMWLSLLEFATEQNQTDWLLPTLKDENHQIHYLLEKASNGSLGRMAFILFVRLAAQINLNLNAADLLRLINQQTDCIWLEPDLLDLYIHIKYASKSPKWVQDNFKTEGPQLDDLLSPVLLKRLGFVRDLQDKAPLVAVGFLRTSLTAWVAERMLDWCKDEKNELEPCPWALPNFRFTGKDSPFLPFHVTRKTRKDNRELFLLSYGGQNEPSSLIGLMSVVVAMAPLCLNPKTATQPSLLRTVLHAADVVGFFQSWLSPGYPESAYAKTTELQSNHLRQINVPSARALVYLAHDVLWPIGKGEHQSCSPEVFKAFMDEGRKYTAEDAQGAFLKGVVPTVLMDWIKDAIVSAENNSTGTGRWLQFVNDVYAFTLDYHQFQKDYDIEIQALVAQSEGGGQQTVHNFNWHEQPKFDHQFLSERLIWLNHSADAAVWYDGKWDKGSDTYFEKIQQRAHREQKDFLIHQIRMARAVQGLKALQKPQDQSLNEEIKGSAAEYFKQELRTVLFEVNSPKDVSRFSRRFMLDLLANDFVKGDEETLDSIARTILEFGSIRDLRDLTEIFFPNNSADPIWSTGEPTQKVQKFLLKAFLANFSAMFQAKDERLSAFPRIALISREKREFLSRTFETVLLRIRMQPENIDLSMLLEELRTIKEALFIDRVDRLDSQVQNVSRSEYLKDTANPSIFRPQAAVFDHQSDRFWLLGKPVVPPKDKSLALLLKVKGTGRDLELSFATFNNPNPFYTYPSDYNNFYKQYSYFYLTLPDSMGNVQQIEQAYGKEKTTFKQLKIFDQKAWKGFFQDLQNRASLTTGKHANYLPIEWFADFLQFHKTDLKARERRVYAWVDEKGIWHPVERSFAELLLLARHPIGFVLCLIDRTNDGKFWRFSDTPGVIFRIKAEDLIPEALAEIEARIEEEGNDAAGMLISFALTEDENGKVCLMLSRTPVQSEAYNDLRAPFDDRNLRHRKYFEEEGSDRYFDVIRDPDSIYNFLLHLPVSETLVKVRGDNSDIGQLRITFMRWKDVEFFTEIIGERLWEETLKVSSQEDFNWLLNPEKKLVQILEVRAQTPDGYFWCKTPMGLDVKVAPDSLTLRPISEKDDLRKMLPPNIKRFALVDVVDRDRKKYPIKAIKLSGELINEGVVTKVIPQHREIEILEIFGSNPCRIKLEDESIRIRVGDLVSYDSGIYYHSWRKIKTTALWQLTNSEPTNGATPIGEVFGDTSQGIFSAPNNPGLAFRWEKGQDWKNLVRPKDSWIFKPEEWGFTAGSQRSMGSQGGRGIFRLPLKYEGEVLFVQSYFNGDQNAVLEYSALEYRRVDTTLNGNSLYKINRRAEMDAWQVLPKQMRAKYTIPERERNQQYQSLVAPWIMKFAEYWNEGQLVQNIASVYLGKTIEKDENDSKHLVKLSIQIPIFSDPQTWNSEENWTQEMFIDTHEFIGNLDGAYPERAEEAQVGLFVDEWGRFCASFQRVLPLASSVDDFVQRVLETNSSGAEFYLKNKELCFLEFFDKENLSPKTSVARFEIGYGQIVELPAKDVFWLDRTTRTTLDKVRTLLFGNIIRRARFIREQQGWIMEVKQLDIHLSERNHIYNNTKNYNMVCHLLIHHQTGEVLQVDGMNLASFDQRTALMQHRSQSANQPELHPDDKNALLQRFKVMKKAEPQLIPAMLDRGRYKKSDGKDFVFRHYRLSFRTYKGALSLGKMLDPNSSLPYTMFLQVDPQVPVEDWTFANDMRLPLRPLSGLDADIDDDLRFLWMPRRFFSANEDTLPNIVNDPQRLNDLRGACFWVRIELSRTGKPAVFLIDKKRIIHNRKFAGLPTRPHTALLGYLKYRPGYPLFVTFIGIRENEDRDRYFLAEVHPGILISIPFDTLSEDDQNKIEELSYGDQLLVRLRMNTNEFGIQPAMSGDVSFIPDQNIRRLVTLLPKDNFIATVKRYVGEPKEEILKQLLYPGPHLGFVVGSLPNIEPFISDRIPPYRDGFWEWLQNSFSAKTATVWCERGQFVIDFSNKNTTDAIGYLQLDPNSTDGLRAKLFHEKQEMHLAWEQVSFADADRSTIRKKIEHEKWRFHDHQSIRVVLRKGEKESCGVIPEVVKPLDCQSGPLNFIKLPNNQLTLRFPVKRLRFYGFPSRELFASLRQKKESEDNQNAVSVYAVVWATKEELWVEICPGRIVELPIGCLTLDEKLRLPVENFFLPIFQTGDLLYLELIKERWGQEKIRLVAWVPSARALFWSDRQTPAILPASVLEDGGVQLGNGVFTMCLPAELPQPDAAVVDFNGYDNLLSPHSTDSTPIIGQTVWLYCKDEQLILHGFDGWTVALEPTKRAWNNDMLRDYLGDGSEDQKIKYLRQLIELLGGGIPMSVWTISKPIKKVYLHRGNQSNRDDLESIRGWVSVPIIPIGLWYNGLVLARLGKELCYTALIDLVKGAQHESASSRKAIIIALSKWVREKKEWLLTRLFFEKREPKFASNSTVEKDSFDNISVTFLEIVYEEKIGNQTDELSSPVIYKEAIGVLFRSEASRDIYYVRRSECLLIEPKHPDHDTIFKAAFSSKFHNKEPYRLFFKNGKASLRKSRAARTEVEGLRIGGKISVKILSCYPILNSFGYRYVVASSVTGMCMEAVEYRAKNSARISELQMAQVTAVNLGQDGPISVKLRLGESLNPLDIAPFGMFDHSQKLLNSIHIPETELELLNSEPKFDNKLFRALIIFHKQQAQIDISSQEEFARIAFDWSKLNWDRPASLGYSVGAGLLLLSNSNWIKESFEYLRDLHQRALRSFHIESLLQLLYADNAQFSELEGYQHRWQKVQEEILGLKRQRSSPGRNDNELNDSRTWDEMDEPASQLAQYHGGYTSSPLMFVTNERREELMDFCRTLQMIAQPDDKKMNEIIQCLETALGNPNLLSKLLKNRIDNGSILISLIECTRPVFFYNDDSPQVPQYIQKQLLRELMIIFDKLRKSNIPYYTMPAIL